MFCLESTANPQLSFKFSVLTFFAEAVPGDPHNPEQFLW